MGAVLALYRLLFFRNGTPVNELWRYCLNDVQALESVQHLRDEYAVEIYQQERLAARVERKAEPPHVYDGQSA